MLYADYRYDWDATMVGLTLAIVGVCSMVVQGAADRAVREAVRRAAGADAGASPAAPSGFAIYALAPTGSLSWLGIPVQAMWGLSNPAIQALMTHWSRRASRASCRAPTPACKAWRRWSGPFLFTLTFAYFIGAQAPLQLPGAPFLLASALLLLALAIAVRTLSDRRLRTASGPH